LELWNTDTKLGHTVHVDMVARLHSFLIATNVPHPYAVGDYEDEFSNMKLKKNGRQNGKNIVKHAKGVIARIMIRVFIADVNFKIK
jgi:hypothetical protein